MWEEGEEERMKNKLKPDSLLVIDNSFIQSLNKYLSIVYDFSIYCSIYWDMSVGKKDKDSCSYVVYILVRTKY